MISVPKIILPHTDDPDSSVYRPNFSFSLCSIAADARSPLLLLSISCPYGLAYSSISIASLPAGISCFPIIYFSSSRKSSCRSRTGEIGIEMDSNSVPAFRSFAIVAYSEYFVWESLMPAISIQAGIQFLFSRLCQTTWNIRTAERCPAFLV